MYAPMKLIDRMYVPVGNHREKFIIVSSAAKFDDYRMGVIGALRVPVEGAVEGELIIDANESDGFDSSPFGFAKQVVDHLRHEALSNPPYTQVGILFSDVDYSVLDARLKFEQQFGVFASECASIDEAVESRKKDNSNLLIIRPEIVTDGVMAFDMILTWLKTSFDYGTYGQTVAEKLKEEQKWQKKRFR